MLKGLKKKSIIVSWLYFFTGLITFVAVVFGTLSYRTQKKMEEQTLKSAQYAYNTALDSVKYHLSSLVNQYINMSSGEDFKRLCAKQNVDWFRDDDAESFLNSLVLQNSVDSATVSYVYFRKSGTVVSKNGVFPAQRYYDEHFRDLGSFDKWEALHSSTEIIPNNIRFRGEKTKNSVMICLPAYAGEGNNAVFAFVLDHDRFFSLNKKLKWLYDADICLADEAGKILFFSGPENSGKADNIAQLREREKNCFSELEYFYHKSKKLGFYFSVPYASLYPERRAWQTLMLLSLLLIIAGMSSAIALFVRFHYKKIRNVLDILHVGESENEWDRLEHGLKSTIEENRRYSESYRMMAETLRSTVLRQLLYIRDDADNIRELLHENGIYIDSELVTVSLIGAEKSAQEAYAEKIKSIAARLNGNMAHGSAVPLKNNTIACICALGESVDGYIKELTGELPPKLKCFTSEPVFLSDIPAAYRDALARMERGGADNSADVTTLFYTMEEKIKLFDSLCIGNYSAADEILTNIFDRIRQRRCSSKIINIFAVDTVSLLLDVTQRKNMESTLNSGVMDMDKKYIFGDGIDEMEQSLKKISADICRRVTDGEKSQNEQLCEQLYDYIAENFRDPNISIKTLADKFRMSPSYLSMNFTRIYGASPKYFINKYRTDEAVKLLKNPALTIEKIAEEIGYCNERTFSRNFKALKDIYPNEYRKLN